MPRRHLPEPAAGPGRHHTAPKAPPVWRAPEGPEGTGGLRGAAPNEVRPPSLAGGRALRRPEHQRRHKHHKQEGRRGACGARPRCRRAAAGPGHARTPDWRPPRDLRGLAAVPVGGGRARAGLEIDHSERSSRVAISRAGRRPPAHTAARPIQAGHAAAGDLAGRATPEIWRDHSHNRQRPGRLLHNSPHGSSPRRPRRISYDIRPVASHARSYRLG